MREYVAESLLHALVASLVVEVLLRMWRLRDPAERLGYRLLVLTVPLLLPPFFAVLAPYRTGTAFAETRALFAWSHWSSLRIGGVGLDAALVVAAGIGIVLFLRDIAPVLRGERGVRAPVAEDGEPDALAPIVAELAGHLGIRRPPPIQRLAVPGPVLFASGLAQPVLVVSTGALERLTGPARRAALAHELAHVARRDLLLGWVVMIVRAALVLNPIAQIVARAAIQEMERRADDTAALATGAPEALADGMAALASGRPRGPGEGTRRRVGPFNEFLADLVVTGRRAAIDARRRRLLDDWPPARTALPRARLSLTAASVAGLLFFVV